MILYPLENRGPPVATRRPSKTSSSNHTMHCPESRTVHSVLLITFSSRFATLLRKQALVRTAITHPFILKVTKLPSPPPSCYFSLRTTAITYDFTCAIIVSRVPTYLGANLAKHALAQGCSDMRKFLQHMLDWRALGRVVLGHRGDQILHEFEATVLLRAKMRSFGGGDALACLHKHLSYKVSDVVYVSVKRVTASPRSMLRR
jgi:hypothetical protein